LPTIRISVHQVVVVVQASIPWPPPVIRLCSIVGATVLPGIETPLVMTKRARVR